MADRAVDGSSTVVSSSEFGRYLEALHPRLMEPRLQAALGGGPGRCHIVDAKYEPGTRAIVLYERAGALVRGDLLTEPSYGDPAVVAPGVRLSPFPQDPDLPALSRVMDPAAMGAALAEVDGPAGYPSGLIGRRCRLHLLRYRPGKRATVMVVVPGERDRYVVKAYHSSGKAAAVAREAPALSRLAGVGTLRFAPTVAHLSGLQAVVQAAVRGSPLSVLVTAAPGSAATRDAVSACARALAEFHDAGSVTLRTRPVERELRRFAARAELVTAVAPGTGAVLGRVAARLHTTHERLPAARVGPVHGDCKPSQFLYGGRNVYLMDLDHLGLSDQAADVGTFLASMRQLAICRAPGRPGHASGPEDGLAEHFLAVFLAASGRHDDVVRIRWQEAVALERKALRAFARAPRSPAAAALATAAERCLDLGGFG